jgi:hypothetical protein
MSSSLKVKGRFDIYSLLLFFTVFLFFVPIPKLPLIGFAPMNLIFPIIALFILVGLKKIALVEPKMLLVLALLLFYYSLDQVLIYYKGHNVGDFMRHGRIILYMFFLHFVCVSEKKLLMVLKFFLIMGAVSTAFGMLVYFIGEPFASIRMWLSQSTAANTFIVKGSQLTGLQGPPHDFGYFLAAAPMLSFSCYLLERKRIWLAFFVLFIVGLFLNAERSALVMNIVAFTLFGLGDAKKRIPVLAMVFCGVILLSVAQWMAVGLAPKGADTGDGAGSLRHGNLAKRMSELSVGEAYDRVFWQWYGVKTVLKHPLTGATKADYIRTVHGLPPNQKNLRRYLNTPFSHNHYVNIGIHIGVLGWLLLLGVLYGVIRFHRETRYSLPDYAEIASFRRGIKLALIAVMGNAFFHNAGLFTGQLTTCSVVALYFSLKSIYPDKIEAKTRYA